MWLDKKIYFFIYMSMCNNINLKQCKKCDFYLRRGDFIMFSIISQLNGSLQNNNNNNNNNKISKYTPTTYSYDFALRYGHQRYIIELSIKIRKTTLEP